MATMKWGPADADWGAAAPRLHPKAQAQAPLKQEPTLIALMVTSIRNGNPRHPSINRGTAFLSFELIR
jgi:hypothetical protein